MAKIVAIILAMIGLVIGANLIAPINTAANVVILTTPVAYSAAVLSLTALIPLLFVVVLMIFAVKSVEI